MNRVSKRLPLGKIHTVLCTRFKAALAFALTGWLGCAVNCGADSTKAPLDTVQSIMSLGTKAALKGLPAKLKGVAVVQDLRHDALFVNDFSGRMPSTICVRGITNVVPVYSLVDVEVA